VPVAFVGARPWPFRPRHPLLSRWTTCLPLFGSVPVPYPRAWRRCCSCWVPAPTAATR